MNKQFSFNETIQNWEDISQKTLERTDGTLFLFDKQTGEPVEAEIVFLYSTRIYSGLLCRGIVKIGQKYGCILVEFSTDCKQVFFEADNTLTEMKSYNKKVTEIVKDMDEDCRYSEAINIGGIFEPDSMKILVKQYHAMQRRNNNPDIPYTEHLHGVASVLKTIAENYNEIPKSVLEFMLQAALGHDLLEDTAIEEDTIDRMQDYEVLQLIRELTNPKDDAHTDEYMDQIASASEEARLIKYADLIENTTSFCYSLHEPNIENPIQRAKAFYLSILFRTTDVLAGTAFCQYPQTAQAMRMVLSVYTNLLLDRLGLEERE